MKCVRRRAEKEFFVLRLACPEQTSRILRQAQDERLVCRRAQHERKFVNVFMLRLAQHLLRSPCGVLTSTETISFDHSLYSTGRPGAFSATCWIKEMAARRPVETELSSPSGRWKVRIGMDLRKNMARMFYMLPRLTGRACRSINSCPGRVV